MKELYEKWVAVIKAFYKIDFWTQFKQGLIYC